MDILELFLYVILIIYLAFSASSLLPVSLLNKSAQIFGVQEKPSKEIKTEFGVRALINKKATTLMTFQAPSVGMPFIGKVSVRGSEWKAEQLCGGNPLSNGTLVTIKRIKGNTLYVEGMERNDV